MRHEFKIERGFNDSTILFCSHCGVSFSLARWNTDGRYAWQRLTFETQSGETIDLSPCCLPGVSEIKEEGSEDGEGTTY